MEAMEAILTRRSVRRYTEGPVSEALIKVLLEAAMSAPSANNRRTWQFVIIDDRKILDAIPTIHPHADMLRQAPLAILVCGDLDRDMQSGFWVQDCSTATQNILLAARAQGLGAVWLGVYPLEDRIQSIRKLVALPDPIIPLSLVSVGYPATAQGPVDRYDARRIHRNKWGDT